MSDARDRFWIDPSGHRWIQPSAKLYAQACMARDTWIRTASTLAGENHDLRAKVDRLERELAEQRRDAA